MGSDIILIIQILIVTSPLHIASVEYVVTQYGACPSGSYGHVALTGISLEKCVHRCKNRPWCELVIYNTKMHLCGLNNSVEYDISSGGRKGCVYVDKRNITRTRQCIERCPLTAGYLFCDSDGTSCKSKDCPPMELVNGQLIGNTNQNGSKKKIVCDYYYMEENNRKFTECSKGTWSYQPSCVTKWRPVFRGIAGTVGNDLTDLYDAWVLGGPMTTTDDVCNTFPFNGCTKYYREPIVDLWDSSGISKVKYALYKDNAEVVYIIFNGTGSDAFNWFDEDKVLESSWDELTSNTYAIFSAYGQGVARRFQIYLSSGGCSEGRGYTVAVNSPPLACTYDVHPAYPQFLYSRLNSHGSPEVDFEVADSMAIYIIT